MFEGKRIVLTGGAGGLGARICDSLRAEGAEVLVVDRSAPAGGGGFLAADLSTQAGIEAAATALAGQDWDVLINLAGIQYFGPFAAQPPEQLYAGYMVNLIAPTRLTQAVLPGMVRRGGGQIVNVGSVFGSINFAHFVSYSSAKAGLRGFSQGLRRELAGTGVAVTYVAPRAVRTPLNTGLVMQFAKLTGMRMDEPETVAARIIEAVRRREAEVFLGFPESLFVRLNALAPLLIDGALAANDRKARALFPV